VLPVPAPLDIVATPLLLTARPVDSCDIDTTVPALLLGSGLAVGKLVSFAIATKPPRAFVTDNTRSFTAFDVGIRVSLFVVTEVSNVIPSSWFSSAVVAVRAVELARFDAVVDCIPASVVSSPSAILSVVTALVAILDDVIALSAILGVVTPVSLILVVITAPFISLALPIILLFKCTSSIDPST